MAVGCGIIGSGYMGRTYAACLTRHVPDGRLVAVTGGTRAAALAAEWGVEAVDTDLLDPVDRRCEAFQSWNVDAVGGGRSVQRQAERGRRKRRLHVVRSGGRPAERIRTRGRRNLGG